MWVGLLCLLPGPNGISSAQSLGPSQSSTSAGGGAVGRHCNRAKEAEKITYVSLKRVDEFYFCYLGFF